jgi:hypothetical protein
MIALLTLVPLGQLGTLLVCMLINNYFEREWIFLAIYVSQAAYSVMVVYFLKLSFNFAYCFKPEMEKHKRRIDVLCVILCLLFLAGNGRLIQLTII